MLPHLLTGRPELGVGPWGQPFAAEPRERRFEPPRSFRRLSVVALPGRDEPVSCSVVGLFHLDRGQIVDGFVGPLMVEPVGWL